MLKTITISQNRKLGGCSATYRSGDTNIFSTCPSSCVLKPLNERGSASVDQEYLSALMQAVPDRGISWTYTHFKKEDIQRPLPGLTVINISADSYEEAASCINQGYPTVITTHVNDTAKVSIESGVRVVRCPAEYNDGITCSNCGKDVPLCARYSRDYVIKFTAHGPQKNRVGTTLGGGCYGNSGPPLIQWRNTAKGTQEKSDSEVLTAWIKTLPPKSLVRHHVVGDLGSVGGY